MLSCKLSKGAHISVLLLNVCNKLTKELETINWEFGIESKIVNTTTDNGFNFVKPFNVHGETAKTVEEESSDEVRSSCSSDNEDEDRIPPVRLLPILEGDKDEEGVGVFLPTHMRCASHIFNLVATTDDGKTLNKCPVYKKYYRSAFAKVKEIWNKQSRSSRASDGIKDNIDFLSQVPNATQQNSVYDAVEQQLIATFDNRNNLKALDRACTIFT